MTPARAGTPAAPAGRPSAWGVIPAAGAGSRIQPLASSKDLLPVGSRCDIVEHYGGAVKGVPACYVVQGQPRDLCDAVFQALPSGSSGAAPATAGSGAPAPAPHSAAGPVQGPPGAPAYDRSAAACSTCSSASRTRVASSPSGRCV